MCFQYFNILFLKNPTEHSLFHLLNIFEHMCFGTRIEKAYENTLSRKAHLEPQLDAYF